MPDNRILATAEVTGPSRTETLMGKSYRVFPATLVREQVLQNNLGRTFLPAEEIEASVEAWNGMPVVLRHPKRRGREVSAREPGILNERGTGQVFRARFEDNALKADVFVDLDRAEEDDEVASIVANVDEGEPEELSTGFATAIENKAGSFEDEDYDIVLRDIRPDHLALLPGEQGACSVDDGCGLGVNEKGEAPTNINIAALDPASFREFAEKHADVFAAAGAKEDADTSEVSDAERSIVDRLLSAVQERFQRTVQQEEPSLDDVRDMLSDTVEESFGGPNVFTWVVELFEDSFVYAVDPQGDAETLWRAPWTMADGEVEIGERVQVEKVTEFVPVENRVEVQTEYVAFAANKCTCEETDMTREEMIDALADNEDVALDADALEGMEDEALASIANLAGVGGEEAEEEETPEPEETAENEDTDPPAWAESLMERVEKLETDTEPVRQEASAEREKLVQQVAANSDFDEEELTEKPLAELQKLDELTRPNPTAFHGLAGPHKHKGRRERDALGFNVKSTLGCGPGDTSRFERSDN